MTTPLAQPIKRSYCTTREAAKLLGVSLRTAQLWVEKGWLEAWKTSGGHRRIKRDSIERLLVSDPDKSGESVRLPAEMDGAELARNFVAESNRPLRIMVVEDNPTLRRLYEITMSRWPMKPRVVAVANGFEALIRLGQTQPDLLVADLVMPEIDGFRMLQSIRKVPELSELAIVVVSGLDEEEIARRGGLPEGIPVLPKPIPFPTLRAIAEARLGLIRSKALSAINA